MDGYSVPNLLGGTSYYNNKGEKVGESIPGLFGNTIFYNNSNEVMAESIPNMFGGNDFCFTDPIEVTPEIPDDGYYWDF